MADGTVRTPSGYTLVTPEKKISLMGAFGKTCAILSLAATAAVYVGGYQIGTDVYDNYQASQSSWTPVATQVLETKAGHMTWGQEGAAFALSLSSGFAAIAVAKKRKDYAVRYASSKSSFYGGSDYSYSNSGGFWDGYYMGSIFNGRSGSGSSGGSSGSSDSGAAILAVLAISGLVIAAGSSAVVSYKAMRANFGTQA